MYSHSEYLSLIEQHLKEINYPEQPSGLYEPIRYTLDGGGKRLRPVLTLAMCEALGTDPMRAINQAMGVEMFHNFTLLHDDVMDHSDMRRGRPTVHVRWNSRTAILSGDAMLTLSSMLAVTDCDNEQYRAVNSLMNRTAIEIYEGQQLDMDFESRTDVSVDDYLNMIRLKTSVLLGCACELGAIMAGASDDVRKAVYAYGEQLGLAFQLRDDMLDTYGDPIVFGKEIGGDILNDKKTWLSITALEEDKDGILRHEIVDPSNDKVRRVRDLYDSLNLPARCAEHIDRYVSDAIGCLRHAHLNPAAMEFFTQLAENTRTRTH